MHAAVADVCRMNVRHRHWPQLSGRGGQEAEEDITW